MPDDGAGFSAVISSPLYSDDAITLEFSARHTGQLLYVPAWSAWLRDDTLRVFDLVRACFVPRGGRAS